MSARRLVWLSTLGCLLGGCGDDGGRAALDAAAPVADAVGADAVGTDEPDVARDAPDPPADAAAEGPGDGATEALPDLPSQPLPQGLAPPRRIVPGDLELVGEGPSACTHQVPPSGNGDRWCAFKRPTGGATELWAVNVSRALAGAAPACDGTSPDCLRLSSSVWTLSPLAGPAQRAANRFEGDTLFIHDQARSTGENAFEGAVSVWRPGWPRARRLSARANACYGDRRNAVAFCLDAVTHQGFVPVDFDLLAGSIAAPPADPAADGLPLVERVHLLRADGEPSVHATFTADGQWFMYSAPPAAGAATASLRILKLDQIGAAPATTLLPDVMDWEISRDGRSLYYLADYADRGGTLVVVDLPGAGNPRRLPFRVAGYAVRGEAGERDVGLGIFVPLPAGGREYRLLPDTTAIDRQVKVFGYRQSLDAFKESKDGRYTAYTKPENGERGFVARNDGSGECMLSPQRGRPPYDYAFLAGSALVFWVEGADEAPDDAFDGWLADPATCEGRQRFAARIAFHQPVGDQGVLFADQFRDGTATLKYAALEGGRWPAAGPMRIRAGVDFSVTVLPEAPPRAGALVFQVTRGPEPERGLYLFTLPAP